MGEYHHSRPGHRGKYSDRVRANRGQLLAPPGTIRADFAESIDANAVHGSDATETAAVEVAFFFSGLEVCAR